MIKKIGWALLVLVLTTLFAAAWYVRQTLPRLDGTLQAEGLSAPVTIARDGADVTHIKGSTDKDVWFSLGYVHAQERGWQLEFNRRVMHGALSEVLGAATLETDKLMRTLGIIRAAQAQWEGLGAEAKVALQAYADGINAFHATGGQALPPEFHVLGVKPGTWTPQDSVGWALMMALDLGGNWGSEFARLAAAKTLPTPRLYQLLAPYGKQPPAGKADIARLYADLDLYRKEKPATQAQRGATGDTQLAQWATDFNGNMGNVEGKGSNNWVVAGSHTVSGKPLLANDPHLGLSAPAIWYFARLQSPGINAIGATLPGLPFVVLGRTDTVAWGITNTGPDVQDLYIEHINPDNPAQYRVPDIKGKRAWATFVTREEVIKVKKQPDVTFTVRSTRHGPVLSDAQKSHRDVIDTSRYVLSLRWTALDADNRTAGIGVAANRAKTVADVQAAYADFIAPMSNLVMADTSGTIAFRAVGRVPLRRADNDIKGLAPSPGWDARYDWAGWIPLNENPMDEGKKGWVSTANQDITPPGYKHFIGQDFVLPDRFDRIETLIAATPKHDMGSMQKIQSDILSAGALRLLPVLTTATSSHPLAASAMVQLKSFDGVMRSDAAAPLIFSVWADEVARSMLPDKMGPALFKTLYGKRHFRFAVEQALLEKDVWWCAPRSCEDHINAAWDATLNRLKKDYGADPAKWRWGAAHMATSSHRPFSNVDALARFFEVRTPTGGDAFTVNVGQYWPVEGKMPFANRHAASMRTVFDLADLENSRFIYQTGQSGVVFSSRYRDMATTWETVGYRPLQMKPAAMAHTLTLTP